MRLQASVPDPTVTRRLEGAPALGGHIPPLFAGSPPLSGVRASRRLAHAPWRGQSDSRYLPSVPTGGGVSLSGLRASALPHGLKQNRGERPRGSSAVSTGNGGSPTDRPHILKEALGRYWRRPGAEVQCGQLIAACVPSGLCTPVSGCRLLGAGLGRARSVFASSVLPPQIF